jgi:hypothetical protein
MSTMVQEAGTTTEVGPKVWTSEQWIAFFEANRELRHPIDWDTCGPLSPQERDLIGTSLQAWQRGETSDGMHLRAVADRYSIQSNDPAFREAIELFIREENRHSELMGRFLDEAGIGRAESNWAEGWFRWLRHRSLDMASWTTPVLLAEVLALVYYDALRKATTSPALRGVCGQLLGDEAAHIRFQAERFATLFQGRSTGYRRLSMLWQGSLFLLTLLVVWWGHAHVLRAGGYTWGRYWRRAWAALGCAWKWMQPDRYTWPDR